MTTRLEFFGEGLTIETSDFPPEVKLQPMKANGNRVFELPDNSKVVFTYKELDNFELVDNSKNGGRAALRRNGEFDLAVGKNFESLNIKRRGRVIRGFNGKPLGRIEYTGKSKQKPQ